MATRRANTDAFSLFAFQDIITSVTGIMILVTLIFSLELTRERPQLTTKSVSSIEDPSPSVDDLRDQLTALQAIFDENQVMLQSIAAMPAAEVAELEATLKERLASIEAFSQETASANDQLRSDVSRTTSAVETSLETLQSLSNELKRLQEEISTTSKSSVVVYNPDPAATKSAWLVDLGKARIRVFALAGGSTRIFPNGIAGEVPNGFIDWARQRDNSQEYFVLLLRPEVIELYDKLHPLLEGMGFDLGFDLIDNDTNTQPNFSTR